MLNKECDWNFILIRMFVSIEVFLGWSWNLFDQEFKLLIFWIYVPYIMQYHRHFFRILSYFNLVQYWQVLFFACFLYLVSYFTHFQLILIIIWEKINLITVRDPVVLWFSVLYREIHWHFMYISYSISNLILSDFTDSLTQHVKSFAFSQDNTNQCEIYEHERDTYLVSLRIFVFVVFFIGSLFFQSIIPFEVGILALRRDSRSDMQNIRFTFRKHI